MSELTKDMQEYIEYGIKVAFSTDTTIDEKLVRELTDAHRAEHGKPACTEFLVYDSPSSVIKAHPACKASNAFFGNMDADWLVSAKYAKEVMGRTDLPKIDNLIALLENVGWFWMSDYYTIVSRRPNSIHFYEKENGERVLHSVDGPAISYNDGWGLFFLDGVIVGENPI